MYRSEILRITTKKSGCTFILQRILADPSLLHQLDGLSYLTAILRKFKVCVEIPLNISGAAADKLTKRLRALLGNEKTASGHVMSGAHACLVPVNYVTTNIFRQLEDKRKAARRTRACDYRHLLLLLPFILSNLFREEVDEYHSRQRGSQPVPKAYRKCCVKCKMKCSHLKLTQRML